MKQFSKRVLAMLLVLCMVLSLAVTGLAVPPATQIITTATGYTSADDVKYNITGEIIANWGARGETSTFLSTYATEFYTGDYTYEILSGLSGGTSASNAGSSALYSTLKTLVTSKQHTMTAYDGSSSVDCKNFYKYTDCVGGDTNQVSLLYMGNLVSSTWDSGKTYNQEHMWPKSKLSGSNSTDKGDIMHLRSSNPGENSSRGNTAYGEGSGYYDPGVSVRGDCARTILYMYTRWGAGTGLWGTSGVFESADIMLKWMEEDPVDTWEMGRNDSVQSITGTRNVYIDYPELAFQLFGKEVPAGMSTPSNGLLTATLVTDASTLKAGDKIVIASAETDFALSTTQNNNNRGQTAITRYEGSSVISFGTDVQIITLAAGSVDGTYAFVAGDSQYLNAASGGNYLRTGTALSAAGSWSISIADGVASIVANGDGTRNVMQHNASSKLFACYAEASQKALAIYKLGGEAPEGGSGSEEPTQTAGLVTDVSTLKAGDQIIIAGSTAASALGITQNTNNRAAVDVTKSADNLYVTFGSDVQIITLEAGATDGTFALNVGEAQYLYAPSNSSNHLKTQSSVDAKASWSISIDVTNGVASLLAGEVSRNDLRYNSQGMFSCYAAGTTMETVSIYKVGATAGSFGEKEEEEVTEQSATLVTNVSSLKAGDRIIIAGAAVQFAISTTQSGNNRPQAAIVKSADGLTVTFGEDVQIITLENGVSAGTFAFNVGDLGYLCSASSSKNYLRSTTTLDANASWNISITDGVASIIGAGSYTRNDLRYNPQGLFACYANTSTMGKVSIYKLGGSGSGDVHSHEYAPVTTPATCTEEGKTVYTCACGATYSETIAALGHNYVNGTCANCGEAESVEPGTSYAGRYYIAVMNGNGNYFYMTNSLGTASTKRYQAVDTGLTTAPSQITAPESDKIFVLEMNEDGTYRIYAEGITGDNKYLGYTSGNSGTLVAVSSALALTVDYADGIYNIHFAASDAERYLSKNTSNAYFAWYKSGQKKDLVLIPVVEVQTEHKHTVVAVDQVDATCTANGTAAHWYCSDTTCPNAGTLYSDAELTKAVSAEELVIPTAGHSYDAGKITTDPTCTVDGVKTYTCGTCGATKTESVPASGHDHKAVVTAPTCEEDGYTTYTCACGDKYTADEVAALGHSYDEGKITTDPTCTEEGVKTYTCGTCGATKTESVDASGHSYVDGVCGTCGAADPDYVKPVVKPNLTLSYPTLNFKDVVYYNVYYQVSDMTDVVEMGLITFDGALSAGTIDDATAVISGYVASGSNYMVHTNGINAKNLGDALYFKVYAKLSDGSYVYSSLAGYHAVAYAKDILANSTNEKMKSLVVAMLNYGAAAQAQFEYKTDSLMNSFLTEEQKALVAEYSADMVAPVTKVDSSKIGTFGYVAGGYSALYPSVSFEGAFSVKFYFTPAKAMDGDLTMYYWSAADYAAADVLTAENATGVFTMDAISGTYVATVEGIAARQIDETIYVAGIYESGGVSYPTGVIAYSLGTYCLDRVANGTGNMPAFAKATIVYGNYAKAYFA